MKYSNDFIKFYRVNVSVAEKLAKKHSISTEAMSKQIPSLLIFEGGKETARFPPINSQSKNVVKVKYDERHIVHFLDIDRKFFLTSAK
jgi:hypothetical protein